jgi:hypothetical protein
MQSGETTVQRLLVSIAISAIVSRACSKGLQRSMNSVWDWAARRAIAALVLLSLAVAYPTAIAADMLIDPLSEVEAFAFFYVLPAVVIGWILFRRMS